MFSLVAVLAVLTGCDEALLRNLSPEQKQYLIHLYQYYSPGSPLPDWLTQSAQSPQITEAPPAAPATQPAVAREFAYESLAQDDLCTGLLSGTPRGLACLHCTEPGAHEQAHILSLLLFRSCVKNIAINYLVDGTFSYDQDLLEEQISLLTSGNRTLFLHFYLSNGPNQRRWRSTPLNVLGSGMPPETFRERILFDAQLQQDFKNIILRLIPVLRFAQSRNAVISIVPMLEDNLDDDAFQKLYELTLETIPPDIYFSVGRSPCPGCRDGNTDGRPQGVFLERHTAGRSVGVEDGLVTNDGDTYRFGPSSREQVDLSLSDLARTRDSADSRNDIFILWKGERQGRYNGNNGPYINPSDREYEIPSFEERQALIDFLKEGLEPEVTLPQ